jgi:hypothetical protein
LLVTALQVLADTRPRPLPLVQVTVLEPFALADGIENQDDVAHPG